MRALALIYAGGRHYIPGMMTAEGLCSLQALAAAVLLWCWWGDACPSLRGQLRAQRGLFSDLLAPEALVLTALPPSSSFCLCLSCVMLDRLQLEWKFWAERNCMEFLARLAVTKALRAVPHLDQRAPFPIQHGHLSQHASPRRSRFPVPQGSPRERRGQQLMSGSRDKGTRSRQRQRGDSSVHGKAERTGECELMTGNEAEGKLQCVSGAGIAAAPWVDSQAFVPWSLQCPDREETETEAQEISVSNMGGC